MGAAGDPAACNGAPVGSQRRVASVSAAHEVGLEGCTAWPGKAAPISSSSRSDRGGRNERQTERDRASARAACARTWRAHVSSSAAARGRGLTCIRGARAPRTISKAFLTASGKAFSPQFPRFPGLFRKLAVHARATCDTARVRLRVAPRKVGAPRLVPVVVELARHDVDHALIVAYRSRGSCTHTHKRKRYPVVAGVRRREPSTRK